MSIQRNEIAHAINGVPGRLFQVVTNARKPGCFTNQTWISASRGIKNGDLMKVEIRYDDRCGNGHNSFAITADIKTKLGRDVAGGCLHDEIGKYFPELAGLVAWHLMGADGPMHYIANAVYMAGDADHNGRRAGEACAFSHGVRFGNSPITHKLKNSFLDYVTARHKVIAAKPDHKPEEGLFRVIAVAYGKQERSGYQFKPKYTFVGYDVQWHDCPFDTQAEAHEYAEAFNTLPVHFITTATDYSEGKTRELEAARRIAIWPEATDEQLSLPRDQLKALLVERLPALLANFRAAIEAIGFTWSAIDFI